MKKSLLASAGASLLALALGATVSAVPITGSIGFAGQFSTDNNANFNLATQFTSFNAVVLSTSGDYAGIPNLTSATFSPFMFTDTSVTPLWTVLGASGTEYKFNATSFSLSRSVSSITASGFGTALITGFDPTPGQWNLAGSGTGLSLTFAAETNVAANSSASSTSNSSPPNDTVVNSEPPRNGNNNFNSVPDGASTVILLGMSLLALGTMLRSRRFAA